MYTIPELEAQTSVIVLTMMTLWFISARYLKTLIRFHKTDDPDYCGCGSHAPNLGSKSHYTAAEFAKRNDKKYRRSNAYIVEKAAQRAYKRYITTRDSKDLAKSQNLNVKWHRLMDNHALKADKKWFACTKCNHVTRRHYVPEDHQRLFGLTSDNRVEFDEGMAGSLLGRAYNLKKHGEGEL